MKVVELYAGSATLSMVAEHMGFKTLSTDWKQYGRVNIVGNVLDDKVFNKLVQFSPDIIWASPPCTAFSIASAGHHFNKEGDVFIPKSSEAGLGIALAIRVFELIRAVRKKTGHQPVWFMENPRGLLQKMRFMEAAPIKHTVTYCQYGHRAMKPTNIWTNCTIWKPRPMCKKGSTCHEAAPRGTKTGGTQGLSDAHERAKLPVQLCKEVLVAAFKQIHRQRNHRHANSELHDHGRL